MFVGPRGRMGLARLMQSRWYMICQVATTLFSLEALDLFKAFTDKVAVSPVDDVRHRYTMFGCCRQTLDLYCDIGLTFCLCFFLIDAIIVSSVDRRHVYSLFWFLDVVRGGCL
jgi:hypothetical protein